MSLRDWWDLLGFRGVLALVVFLVLTYFGISGWISDGWTTGLSIIVGAFSAAVAIVAYGQAVVLDAALGAVAFVLTIIGFSQYLDDSRQHTKESLAAYDKAYGACARGDAKGCDEGMKLFMCKYMESNQDLMRAATSAHININVPKEISGVVDMNAQHDINMLPPACQSKR
ncbi:hypothetical protein [Insolitispirillum peregrinum]|uniref:Uncharacterized protein n=1 Tax=Insolitispirillum peregrinum TaxID=80876 RepID=A0A1N7PDR9_9PROT|nr:hypothetical protein [Insolitispirillum peregrinum]SIT08670.1 hypothetical protein SAMN05421779_106245 [Insolitispirillum peregrinum]